ncbi:hypothetical protein D3C85_1639710 [compost metagenome]
MDQRLQVGQVAGQRRIAGDETHAQGRGKRFGKTAQVDRALQLVQRRQAHGGRRPEVGQRIVLDHRQVVALGQLQDLVRLGR